MYDPGSREGAKEVTVPTAMSGSFRVGRAVIGTVPAAVCFFAHPLPRPLVRPLLCPLVCPLLQNLLRISPESNECQYYGDRMSSEELSDE